MLQFLSRASIWKHKHETNESLGQDESEMDPDSPVGIALLRIVGSYWIIDYHDFDHGN
jgi:hypothetical protein